MYKQNNIFVLACILCIIAVSVIGCDSEKTVDMNFQYGVITSSERDSYSEFIYLDSELNVHNSGKYKYASVGGFSYHTPYVVNNVMYDISLGKGPNKDDCAIVGLNLQTGEITGYPFENRANITDFAVTNKYIYTISNLNQKTYVDRYSFENNKTDTYIMENKVGIDLCLCNDDIYVFVEEDGKYNMYLVDIMQQKLTHAYDLTKYCIGDNEPSYYAVYNNHIYLPCNEYLIELCLEDGSIKELQLPYKEAFGTYVNDNLLYVSCTDYFDEKSKAKIAVYDMERDELKTIYQLQGSLMQFMVKDNYMIVMGLDDIIYKYEINEQGKCNLVKQTEISHDSNHVLSALFAKE